jgi:hypothetical protein
LSRSRPSSGSIRISCARVIEGNLRSLRVDQPAAVNFRLPGHGHADARFDDQMGAMVAARDEGSSLV